MRSYICWDKLYPIWTIRIIIDTQYILKVPSFFLLLLWKFNELAIEEFLFFFFSLNILFARQRLICHRAVNNNFNCQLSMISEWRAVLNRFIKLQLPFDRLLKSANDRRRRTQKSIQIFLFSGAAFFERRKKNYFLYLNVQSLQFLQDSQQRP